PLTVSDEAVRRVGTLPALQRAAELYALERYGPARREWQQAQPGLAAEELAAAAAGGPGRGGPGRARVGPPPAGPPRAPAAAASPPRRRAPGGRRRGARACLP
ncbi:MAG: hypothetical protein KMY51_16215, partial [Desulfomicrobium sp.]|nr:hypothetical protein [Desulfomicrobium sp.]